MIWSCLVVIQEVRRFSRPLDVPMTLLSETDFYEEAMGGSEEEMNVGK